jgi:hypothetical protein
MMSEGTSEVSNEGTEARAKRKVLSFGDRIKVVDYLRSLVEPIVSESNAAVAAFIGDATGVEINWPQLKYMIDELPELKLAAKIHVKSSLSAEDEFEAMRERIASLEEKVAKLDKAIADMSERFIA